MHWPAVIPFLITLLFLAFFAGVEMAYYSANRLSLELRRKQGGTASQLVARFVDNPAKFLGMTLIGYSLALVVLVLGVSEVMHPVWHYFNIRSEALHVLLEILLTTLVVLVLGNFIPRAWFRARSTAWLHGLARVIDFFYGLFAPVATALVDASEWILKYVFNIRLDKNREPINRNDLKNLFVQEMDENEERNTQLMENAQELPKVKIRQCLVPRKEIVGVESGASVEELKSAFIETKLSKLVVYENNIDHIIGYVHQLDLFKKPASIKEVLLPIPAVPESMSATDLIGKFTRERKSIAWVVDEFGGTAGIITMEDVLEELFGEIQDEYDIEEFVEKTLSDTEFLFSGRLELDYLEEKYGFDFGEDESETLSGYIINNHETIPAQKDRIIIDDFEFEIQHVSDTRIELVKMRKLK